MISADAIRGYIDLMILSLLRSTPSYAYEIAQQISEVTGDEYAIKPGFTDADSRLVISRVQ